MKQRLPRKLKKFYKKEIPRLLEKNEQTIREAFYEIMMTGSACVRYDRVTPRDIKCEVMSVDEAIERYNLTEEEIKALRNETNRKPNKTSQRNSR